MSPPFPQEHIAQLKLFVQLCTADPSILHLPDFAFFKTFVERFGGKIPDGKPSPASGSKCESSDASESKEEPVPQAEPESEESDLELDMTGVLEPDNDPPQKMGNPSLEPSEEELAESQSKRSEAVAAYAEKDYEKALQFYTEAIVLNPHAALLYAKRGQVYLQLKKPNACIRDCDRALELNPDSAAAHKFRGRANQLLGKWEEAANNLRRACQFDFDEEANEWLREVTPNARKIEEHKRKQERRKEEKLERERQEKLKKAREAAKAREENSRTAQTDTGASAGMGDFYEFLNDPEVSKAFQDPEVAEAFKEISLNPTNILKYQSNPKIMALINKMASKFGGVGGMPGGFPGMMGGMPGFGARPPPQSEAPKKPSNFQDDVGLD